MRVFRKRIFGLNKVHREGESSNRAVIIFLTIMAVGVSAVTSCSRADKPVEYKPLDDIQRVEYLKQNPFSYSDTEIQSLDPFYGHHRGIYKFYYIDKTGRTMIGPEFTMAGPFSEGLAYVRWGRKESGQWGYINKNGETVLGRGYDDARTFINGYAEVKKDGMWYTIDTEGRDMFESLCKEVDGISGGLAPKSYHDPLSDGRRAAYINDAGRLIGGPDRQETYKFREGLGRVKNYYVGIDNKYGFVDETGAYAVKPVFDEAFDFHEGLAGAMLVEEGYEPPGCSWSLHKPGKWGFINKEGDWVIEPKFDYIQPFFEGLASAFIRNDNRDRATSGYIDKTGEWVITGLFGATIFVDGRAIALFDDRKHHCINNKGEIVGDATFDEGMPFFDGMACVKVGDKWGFINSDGEMAIEPQFEFPSFFSEGLAHIASSEYDPANPINMPAIEGSFYIPDRRDDEFIVKVFDDSGEVIATSEVVNMEYYINVPPGKYVLKLYSTDGIRVEDFDREVDVPPGRWTYVAQYRDETPKDAGY